MAVSDYLSQFQFNGTPVTGGSGTFDPSKGGFTTSNAPFIFARLLEELSKPGGALSSLSTSRAFAGEVESIIGQSRAARGQVQDALVSSGVNEAQALQQVGGFDQQLLSGLTSRRAARETEQQGREQEALTTFANSLSQAEDVQKSRTEQLRQFDKLYKNFKKQQQLQNILQGVGLVISAVGAGSGSFLGSLFGAIGSSAANKAGGDASASELGSQQQSFNLDTLRQGAFFPSPQGQSTAPNSLQLPAISQQQSQPSSTFFDRQESSNPFEFPFGQPAGFFNQQQHAGFA